MQGGKFKMTELKHLFTSARIGAMELKNRIVMLPMTTGYSKSDETVGDRFIDFFAKRAMGGAGLIVVPFSPIDAGSAMQPGLYDDRFMEGARRLVRAVHENGAKIAVQLIAQYHMVMEKGIVEVVGPSSEFNEMMRTTPRGLTIGEIHDVIRNYGDAARRAQDAGFDAVEVLVGGGYLLNRFMSPVSNKRDDEYGGGLEQRMQIILEVIAVIKQQVGAEYPVTCRLNVDEQMEGGHTIDDSKKVAGILEGAGIHAINMYTGWHESPVPTVQQFVPRGAFVHLAEAIRGVVEIPVIAANRINDPLLAETIVAEGKADLVGMGRALLADPELPRKAQEGRIEEIVPCIACSQCLSEVLTAYRQWGIAAPASCTVNPCVGRERECAVVPTGRPRKVLVVGGGPGGMTAATVAAQRGHEVSLFEEGGALGGKLLVASIPPYKDEIGVLTERLIARTKKAGVNIFLNTKIDEETLADLQPAAVILATGAVPLRVDLPGIDKGHVTTAEKILTGCSVVTGNVVIVGGGMVGCETAEFLSAKRGIDEVIVVEMMGRIANDVPVTSRPFFLVRLKKEGIQLRTHTTVQEITDDGVVVEQKGVEQFIPADTIVLAVGFSSNDTLAREVEGKGIALYTVGDCAQPRTIREAIAEGFDRGMKV